MISETPGFRLLFSRIYSSAEAFTQTAIPQIFALLGITLFKLILTAARELKALAKTLLLYRIGQTKNFNFHGLNPQRIPNPHKPAILLLHGDKHNQSGMLPLAKYLSKADVGSLFTVNLDYSETYPAKHRHQLTTRILEIKELYDQDELRLIIVGHSKGAIEAAHLAFCEDRTPGVKIEKIISIAGRLKVVNSSFRSCHQRLVPLIHKIYRAIKRNFTVPFYNIAGDLDWNAPVEAMIINDSSKHACVIPNQSHMSILFAEETHKKVLEYISK